MSSSIISFEEKLAAVLKLGVLDYDGNIFDFTPRSNEGYKIIGLKKGWCRTNTSIVALVDNVFTTLCSTTQKTQVNV